MTRTDVTAAHQTALSSENLTALPIVFLDIDGDPLWVWAGIGDLVWGGNTYLGVGDLARVQSVKSDAKGSLPSIELSLVGLKGNMLANAKGTKYAGRTGKVYIGLFDENHELIDEPALFFAGEMSLLNIAAGRQEKGVSVTIDSRLAVLKQNRPIFRTQEDQQRQNPGDTLFYFVSQIVNKTVYWGLSGASRSSGRGSTGYADGVGETHSGNNNTRTIGISF